MTTCSRIGCTKKLRTDNTKGVCSKNCLSMEAPPAARAEGVSATSPVARVKIIKGEEITTGSAMKRFREVAEVVGLDADQVLEEFAQSWLDGLREKLNAA